jgi:hypothetical protein
MKLDAFVAYQCFHIKDTKERRILFYGGAAFIVLGFILQAIGTIPITAVAASN